MKFSKEKRRNKIKKGIRNKIEGTTSRPRLSVFRSNKAIYAQIIDDMTGCTLCAASSLSKEIIAVKQTKIDAALMVGKALAEKATTAGISSVVFDRNGFLYHGRVKALAEGAREGGLQF